MAFRRRKGNEAKSRKKRRKFEAKQLFRESVREALHFINTEVWRERSFRGRQREKHVAALLKMLCERWEILNFASAGQWSWMNHVLKADCVVQRLSDKVAIPIQVKATADDVKKFLLQHGADCIRMYGAPPIIVIAPAEGFHNPLSRALALLREINDWKGYGFDFQQWMNKDDDCFNDESPIGVHGFEERVREFVRRHPECFQTREAYWRDWFEDDSR